jgi:hypothetical protein
MMEWTGERNVLVLGRAVGYIASSTAVQKTVERGLVSHAEALGLALHARVGDRLARRPSCGVAANRVMVFLGRRCTVRLERQGDELPDKCL